MEKKPWHSLFVLSVGLLLMGVASAAAEQGGNPEPAVQTILDKLLGAIKKADRDAFVADANAAIKKGTTQDVMDALQKEFGARLEKGYKATYLCQVKQLECQVHLWKMTFKDDGDDIVVRVALKDGKVTGFFLQ
jgi:thioredoxin-like negative regulator of GroEL